MTRSGHDGDSDADDDFVPNQMQREESFPLRPIQATDGEPSAAAQSSAASEGPPTPSTPSSETRRSERVQPVTPASLTSERTRHAFSHKSSSTLPSSKDVSATGARELNEDAPGSSTSRTRRSQAAAVTPTAATRTAAQPVAGPSPFPHDPPEYTAASYGSHVASQSRRKQPPEQRRAPRKQEPEQRRARPKPADRPEQEDPAVMPAAISRRPSGGLGPTVIVGGVESRFGVPETPLVGEIPSASSDGKTDDEDGGSDVSTSVGSAGADGDAGVFVHGGAGDSSDEEEDSTAGEEDDRSSLDPPDNSPYPQVRASVSPVDDTTLSINTPRMWTLSILFSLLGSSTNLFFSLRYPSVAITPVIALLLVHPLGHLWDWVFKRKDDPQEEFVDGVKLYVGDSGAAAGRSWLERTRLWLAQGRWNEKEHSCVYVSSNVSFGFAFATDVIVEQTRFYHQEVSIVYQLLLTLSTQILGYAFAGLTRRFLVRPSGMIWPGTLMSAAMFTTLHRDTNKAANGWTVSRWKFFYIVWGAAATFYFLPGLLFPALSYFNVITWFAPDNVVVANLFGVVSGLGLFPLTFDWAQIAYIGSPLLTPFWAAMNVVGGLVVVMWIIAPVAYYGNLFFSSYMPILSSDVYDNTGKTYDVSRILTPDFVFDRDAYLSYSRVFLPITYVLSYGLQFAGLAALLTHTAVWHGRDIWRQWRKSLREVEESSKPGYRPIPTASAPGSLGESPASDGADRPDAPPELLRRSSSFSGEAGLLTREDVHNRLMRRYRDAPMWWYLATFVSMTVVGIFVVEYYPVHLPWYGLLMALGICAILFIPIGIIMAVTNQQSSIYLICQLICGVVFPGRPVANMVFVTYGYISSMQGIKFAADLKLGHYMKIPPRILFAVQMAATIVSSATQIAVLNWMFRNVPGLCTPDAVNGFTCPIARVHFNGSILWGVVGPAEFFGPGALYRPLVWCFLIGAVAPIPLWWYGRGAGGSKSKSARPYANIVRKINLPVLFGSLSWIPPATGLNFSVWAVVCYLFNYRVRRAAPEWWAKYVMPLSAALDSGLAFSIVVVFFAFIYPNTLGNFSWWGTEVYKQGCDWKKCAFKTVENGSHFGPDRW